LGLRCVVMYCRRARVRVSESVKYYHLKESDLLLYCKGKIMNFFIIIILQVIK